jgi:MoaA/NifB/PqqE/SkfB family radical SAM enzyme
MVTTGDGQAPTTDTLQEDRRSRRAQLPKPYPDPEAWNANLKAGLASDLRRKENYEKFQQAKRSIDVDYLPIRMDVENVSRCNFRCTMCQVSDWGPTYQRAGDMSVDEFKALVDEQYGLIEIKLQGMGEPLLGRDTYFEMIRYARDKHIWVRSTNNGSLLHFKDNYKRLIDSGINEVQISIDGATKETFESIRRGSKFELVMSNCKLINNYCNERRLLRTRMWTVLQQGNVAEILDFVTLAHELGFRRHTFALSLSEWGKDRWAQHNRGVTVESTVTPEMAQTAIDIGKGLGVEVTFWDIASRYSTNRPDTICGWPFERSYVSSDMRIVPCCMIADPDALELGDATKFTEVWNSDTYREFRRAHLEGRIPQVCRGCYKNGEGGEQPAGEPVLVDISPGSRTGRDLAA